MKNIKGSLGVIVALSVAVVVASVAFWGIQNSDSKNPNQEQKQVSVKRLTGHVSSERQNYDLTLAAILIEGNQREADGVGQMGGSVQVQGVLVNGFRGHVVEVVPPNDTYDHWCVNIEVDNVPSLEGFNSLWYIRDVGDGKTSFDEVGQSGGFGTSCAEKPEPSRAFEAVSSGDFRTRVQSR